jgi:hypothetical protein
MSMPENSSPPIDAGANMTRVEAWYAGTQEGFRGYRGLALIGLTGAAYFIGPMANKPLFPWMIALGVQNGIGGFVLKRWASHLPHMERAWAFSLGVLTPLMILGVFASGLMMESSLPWVLIGSFALGAGCGAFLPLLWMIGGITPKRLYGRLEGLFFGSLFVQYALNAIFAEPPLGFFVPTWIMTFLPWIFITYPFSETWETGTAAQRNTPAHDTGLTDPAGSMPDNESEGSQDVPASVVWWFFLASQVAYGAFLFFRTSEGPKNPPEALLTSMPLIALVFGALALVVYHRSGGREAMAGPSGVRAPNGVITWALAGAVAACGLVVAMLLDQPISFVPYALASLALLIWTRPPAA